MPLPHDPLDWPDKDIRESIAYWQWEVDHSIAERARLKGWGEHAQHRLTYFTGLWMKRRRLAPRETSETTR